MTDFEKQLLAEFDFGIISEKVFLKRFPVDIINEPQFVSLAIKDAIKNRSDDDLRMAMLLIWLSKNYLGFIDVLNELLINPNHIRHQEIVMILQHVKSPSTVPFAKKALETNFDYLQYTCSDSDAIAKWFSHLLASIGTPEAIALIEEYSNSPEDGVRNEMLYRLWKMKM